MHQWQLPCYILVDVLNDFMNPLIYQDSDLVNIISWAVDKYFSTVFMPINCAPISSSLTLSEATAPEEN